MRIALDVMGGDHGCVVALAGVKLALQAQDSIGKILLVGREADIASARATVKLTDARVEVVNATEVLTMEDKPLEGIRKKKDSSLVRAIELVRHGQADAVISPGNTGALVRQSPLTAINANRIRRSDAVPSAPRTVRRTAPGCG